MSSIRYKIGGLSAQRDEFDNLMEPLLTEASHLGHQCHALRIGKTGRVLDFLRSRRIDFCLLTGRTVGHLLFHAPSLLSALREASVPLVILWYDNPLRYLDYISRVYAENVILLTSIDSKCVRELQALGFDRVAHFPIWSLTLNFHPTTPTEPMRCELSFSGGYMSREYFETVYMPQFLPAQHQSLHPHDDGSDKQAMWAVIENFVDRRRKTRHYVDVYDYLRSATTLDPLGSSFHGWSSLLMQYQKILEREQLFDSVLGVPDALLHVYGGADVVVNKQAVMAPAWDRVAFHPSLARRTELQQLYNSTEMNLGLSQFPCAVHNRYFECAACGGFMIGEYKEDLEGLFEVGQEIVCFRDLDELPELIRFYRTHEAERQQIGAKARERHLKQHTPQHRMQMLMPMVTNALERFRDLDKVMA